MSRLDRRVRVIEGTTLQQIDAAMAAEGGCTVEALRTDAARLMALAADVGMERVLETCAAELGITAEELRRDVDSIVARFVPAFARS